MKLCGTIVEEDYIGKATINIADGEILSIHRGVDTSADRIFSDDHLIFPGFIDLGATVSFGEETPISSSIAALSGGITALADISCLEVAGASAIQIVDYEPEYVVINNSNDLMENPFTAVTPHHLFFTSDEYNNNYLNVEPPLPSKSERDSLFEYLDMVDILISGHIPYTAIDKINLDIPGVPALDTYSMFISWLIVERITSKLTVFELACKNPGVIFEKLTGRKVGRLLPGYEASLTVLNLGKTGDHGRALYTRSGWSPFDLRSMPGFADVVYYKGEKMVDGDWITNVFAE